MWPPALEYRAAVGLLEDDAALGQGIRFALENDGIQVELCTALSQAQSILPSKGFDLLILDVNLPDGSSIIGGRTKITRDEADLNGNNVLVHITNNKDEWGQDGKLQHPAQQRL